MASHYTCVTHISTCPHTVFTQVRGALHSHTLMSTAMPTWLRFHLSTSPPPPKKRLLYLCIPINGGCSFLYMTLCNIKILRDRQSGRSQKSCITSVMQSLIPKDDVTYKDVPTHHSAVYHVRVLDLPLSDQPPILVTYTRVMYSFNSRLYRWV